MATGYSNLRQNDDRLARGRSGYQDGARSHVVAHKHDLWWLGLALCGVSALVSLYSLAVMVTKLL